MSNQLLALWCWNLSSVIAEVVIFSLHLAVQSLNAFFTLCIECGIKINYVLGQETDDLGEGGDHFRVHLAVNVVKECLSTDLGMDTRRNHYVHSWLGFDACHLLCKLNILFFELSLVPDGLVTIIGAKSDDSNISATLLVFLVFIRGGVWSVSRLAAFVNDGLVADSQIEDFNAIVLNQSLEFCWPCFQWVLDIISATSHLVTNDNNSYRALLLGW